MTRSRQAPAHSRRRRWRAPASEERLRALERYVTPLSPHEFEPLSDGRTRRFALRTLVTAVVIAVAVLAGLQWLRPVPSPEFQSSFALLRLPGARPVLPWPSTGSAALAVVGAGGLGQSGSPAPVPIGGLAKVMTALVVLTDHPLSAGSGGPAIPVSASDVAVYQLDRASQQSVVPLAVGETLTEEQALEALLVASGNDIGTLLADWDAGGTAPFVAKMNATARHLGLTSTTFDDPSGASSGSMSTTGDLIRLGETAMAIPVFADIVALPQTTLPLGGTFYSLDTDLGRDGFVGIKTGSGAASGGCFLFEARVGVFGTTFDLVGVVLGQQAVPQTPTAVREADVLVRAAFSALAPLSPVGPGLSIGRIAATWGSATPVVASGTAPVIGWPGLSVAAEVRVGPLPDHLPKGAPVGVLRVTLGRRPLDVVLRTKTALSGPSALWRLTRL